MKNNILQITGFPEGGIGTHVISLCQELIEEYNISLVANFTQQDENFRTAFKVIAPSMSNITDIKINKKPSINDLYNLYNLYNLYKNKNINLIHGHGAKGGLYARILGYLLKSKVVYTPHGGSLHDMHGKVMGHVYILIEKFLFLFTDKFIFESKYSKNIFIKKINKKTNKLIVNYNGVKIDHDFTKNIFDKSKIEIASFGLLRNLKGHDILIKAISTLIDEKYNIKLTIYGSGEEKENLECLISELNLDSQVQLFGFVNDTKKYMKKSDIIVHPSRFEALPYVPIEAMNLCKPVIVSNVGGLTEIVIDEENGLVFENECIECLVQKIKKIILLDELREKISNNGKKTVLTLFDEKNMINNLKNIYTGIVD